MLVALAVFVFVVTGLFLYRAATEPRPGRVLDEAAQVKRLPASFPAAPKSDLENDYFREMDLVRLGGGELRAVSLTSDEIKGRNMWIVWTGGNDRFWDAINVNSFGNLDFVKTLSSYDPDKDSNLTPKQKATIKPRYKFTRDNRWSWLGLVNEPCFKKAEGPDPKRFGLWLDQRDPSCSPDPFENEENYPGVHLGARGKAPWPQGSNGSYYGYASGIVGLRLFPNPKFDEAAAKKWNAERYYTDPNYYNSEDLIRPFRVGMSCAFCHVGPNPVNPPIDPENPEWKNLSSNVGAQYFWIDRIFSWEANPSNYIYQLFHTSRPGSLDTSLVSTDNINNPRTMNAVYNLGARLEVGKKWGREALSGGGKLNKQFKDFDPNGPLSVYYQAPDTVWTPHVLKDGSDSVGALGALNRVYLNIGLFSEEWLLHFRPLFGGKRVSPIEIAVARKNSAYWRATEDQTLYMAKFFLVSTAPHHLKDAPGAAKKYLTEDRATLTRGKIVFAERCARCHSSKFPTPPEGSSPGNCAGPDYLKCWNNYWQWTKTDEFKKQMRAKVLDDHFLDDNVLSNDARVPVTLLHTNACSPLATNGIGGNIWDNFTSESYKDLPSVGTIRYYDPITGAPRTMQAPAGGRGYTRPASLVSLWSTAPYLLNNSVGPFNPSPSVDARMQSFQSSIEQMLWPEKREQDEYLAGKIPGKIDRIDNPTYIRIPKNYLPWSLRVFLKPEKHIFPYLFDDKDKDNDNLAIGPFPKGLPVDLLANLNITPKAEDGFFTRLEQDKQLLPVLLSVKDAIKKERASPSGSDPLRTFDEFSALALEHSNCPDFIVNRGHYFGTGFLEPGATDQEKNELASEPGLSDADKKALIAFLKTF
jgi:hypothetical protein